MGRSRSSGRSRRDPAPEADDDSPDVVNGWTLLFHPLLLDQLERLVAVAESERKKARRGGTAPTANVKVLEALRRSLFERIPADPTREEFRQGDTLGRTRRHWFRDKFGAGRFRLFFRYRTDMRVIVYAWVNDTETLRTYGSRTDAYAVFRDMLDDGNPPDSWEALLAAAQAKATRARARKPTRGGSGSPPRDG